MSQRNSPFTESHEHKVALYVLGAMDWLQQHDYIRFRSPLQPKGRAEFDQLEASGFRPTEKDATDFLRVLVENMRSAVAEDDLQGVAFLVANLDAVKSRGGCP